MWGQDMPTGRRIDDPDEVPGSAVAGDLRSAAARAQTRAAGRRVAGSVDGALAARAAERAVSDKADADRRKAANVKTFGVRTVTAQPPGPPPLAKLYGPSPASGLAEPVSWTLRPPPLTPAEQRAWKVKLAAFAATLVALPLLLEAAQPPVERPRRYT